MRRERKALETEMCNGRVKAVCQVVVKLSVVWVMMMMLDAVYLVALSLV